MSCGLATVIGEVNLSIESFSVLREAVVYASFYRFALKHP